jgi:hypothetical protein
VSWGVLSHLDVNRILQHDGRRLFHILLWCLLRGRLCRRMGKTTRVFQSFEISDMGEMMSVMAELTTKGTREDGFNIILPFAFIIISPLGVLVPLGSGCSQRVGVVGVDSYLDPGCCYSYSILSYWNCSMDGLDWLCSTIQIFGIVEQVEG